MILNGFKGLSETLKNDKELFEPAWWHRQGRNGNGPRETGWCFTTGRILIRCGLPYRRRYHGRAVSICWRQTCQFI